MDDYFISYQQFLEELILKLKGQLTS